MTWRRGSRPLSQTCEATPQSSFLGPKEEYRMASEQAIFDRYHALDRSAKDLQRAARIAEAQARLDELISLVTANRSTFRDPEDRLRSLTARKHMLRFEDARRSGAPSALEHLRAAASSSTPVLCVGQPCETLNADLCVARRTLLTPWQRRMCIAKIDAECTALKVEAAIAARHQDFAQALSKRRAGVALHQRILALDPHPNRAKNHSYLEYWLFIVEGFSALLQGDFSGASRFFREVQTRATLFSPDRFFPNYFRDLREIQAHHLYIEGVERVAAADFAAAAARFGEWLNLHADREGTNDLRYDNTRALHLICKIFATAPDTSTRTIWDQLETHLYQGHIVLTTWALWDRLVWIRELSLRANTADPSYVPVDLSEEKMKLARDWRLFVFEAQLVDEDRQAGQRRETRLPAFLDVFPLLDPTKHAWQLILLQNLKNLFLMMADYEQMRYEDPPPEEAGLPRLVRAPRATEAMSIPQLGQVVATYLTRRAASHKVAFEDTLSRLPQLNSLLGTGAFRRAVDLQRAMFDAIRSWPHVVRVVAQDQVPTAAFAGLGAASLLRYRTKAVRLWNRQPREITFEGPKELEPDEYYYLRPQWNIKMQERIRIMHEQFHRSDIPKHIDAFFRTLFGYGKIDARRFQQWIFQFDETERLLACRLVGMLRYYDEDDVRNAWLSLYRSKLPPETKIADVAYVGLGHTAKSGSMNNYYFRQAMYLVPQNERSFEFKEAFRDIAELDATPRKPTSVVFVDDFIGLGDQAVGLIRNYLTRYAWLRRARLYYTALVGFRDGITNIRQALDGALADIFVADELEERDRAFSPTNSVWRDQSLRAFAENWAATLGAELLRDNPRYDPQRDSLGWYGSQALVVFHYNIPNNTLALFWAGGQRNSRAWRPLFDRYD